MESFNNVASRPFFPIFVAEKTLQGYKVHFISGRCGKQFPESRERAALIGIHNQELAEVRRQFSGLSGVKGQTSLHHFYPLWAL